MTPHDTTGVVFCCFLLRSLNNIPEAEDDPSEHPSGEVTALASRLLFIT